MDVKGTLLGRCVHAVSSKLDILGTFRGDTTARWQIFWMQYKRYDFAVWCNRGFRLLALLEKPVDLPRP